MNREELKKVLKPLVKQCIREVLLEESGVLSNVVTEVVHGLSGAPQKQITEQREVRSREEEQAVLEEQRRQRTRARRELAESIGKDAYAGIDLFEGTEALSSGGSVEGASPSGPMANINPHDPGVDLNSIPRLNLSVAKKLIG